MSGKDTPVKKNRPNSHPWLMPVSVSASVHGIFLLVVYIAYVVSVARNLVPIQRPPAYSITLVPEEEIKRLISQKDVKPVEKTKLVEKTKELEKIKVPCPPETLKKIEKKFPQVTQSDVRKLLDETKKFALGIKDQMGHLSNMINAHQSNVSKKGQEEIITLLGKSYQKVDFVPQSAVQGEFDWEDFTIYDIKKADNPKGYIITYVDRAGRTLVTKYEGDEAKEFDAVYQAFSLCGRSSMLKSLLDYTLKSVPTLLKNGSK